MLSLMSVVSADDMDAVPVKQFVKHVSERHSIHQRKFSEDFEVNPPQAARGRWSYFFLFFLWTED